MTHRVDHAFARQGRPARVLFFAGSSLTETSAEGTWDILPAPARGFLGRLPQGYAGTGGIFSFIR